jgi:1-pyrroline-5-carboxylate dehydrogenase
LSNAGTVTHANWGALDNDEFHAQFDCALDGLRSGPAGEARIFIGGRFETSSGGLEDRSPGDPAILLGTVTAVDGAVVSRAFDSASEALPGWDRMGWQSRLGYMRRLRDVIDRERFKVSALLSLEIGKNRFEAMTEVEEALGLINYYADEMEARSGFSFAFPELGDEQSLSVLRPYGVWGVLGPSNFPFALVIGMSVAALIAGNAVVVKPPDDAPLPALLWAEMIVEADLPPGVVNVITGGAEVGKAIVGEKRTAAIAFTGSAGVGKQIAAQLVPAGKPVVAEMGGKNAAIVTATADIELAGHAITRSAFRYSGQKCSACSRVFVAEGVVDELVEALLAEAGKLDVGIPWERGTTVGSLINQRARDRYVQSVGEAEQVAASFHRLELPEGLPTDGAYASPAIAVNLPEGHRLGTDELFLPFVTVRSVKDFDEAILRANDTEFGLTAGIYSGDQGEVARFFDEIEAGAVYANRRAGATTGAWVGHQSFGGWKSSGATGKNAHGPYYLPLFMREQSRTIERGS